METLFNHSLLFELQNDYYMFKIILPNTKTFLIDIVNKNNINVLINVINDIYILQKYFYQFISYSGRSYLRQLIKDKNPKLIPILFSKNWENKLRRNIDFNKTNILFAPDYITNDKSKISYKLWLGEVHSLIFPSK